MGVLLLKCAATGREFSTRIAIEQDDFAKFPDAELMARCPHCDESHAWRTHEARWVVSIAGLLNPLVEASAGPERKRKVH
jgi:hypothetical protein